MLDRVGYGRDNRVSRALARFFCSKWAFAVGDFDKDGFDLWGVQRCGQFVVQQRWYLVQSLAENLLLHDSLPAAHVGAAFDLPATSKGLIDCPTSCASQSF